MADKKGWVLYVACGSMDADLTAVELKDALGLGVFEVMDVANRIPGPFFTGSRADLEFAADELQMFGVECSVREGEPEAVEKAEYFRLPEGNRNLSLKEAYRLLKHGEGGGGDA